MLGPRVISDSKFDVDSSLGGCFLKLFSNKIFHGKNRLKTEKKKKTEKFIEQRCSAKLILFSFCYNSKRNNHTKFKFSPNTYISNY